MYNQIRADFYRLFHSRLCWVIALLFIISFTLFTLISVNDTAFPFGAFMESKEGVPLREGFIGLQYQDPANPLFWELAYSSTAFTAFLWIGMMVLSVQFISHEYQTGSIKLSVAYGINIFKIYLSKFIVVAVYSGLLYYIFNIAAFAFTAYWKGYVPTFGDLMSLFTLITLYFLLHIGFILICFTLYILIQNTVVVSTIMPIFMFSYIVVVTMFGSEGPALSKLYIEINPYYYMSIASRYWADFAVTRNILIYAAISIPIMLAGSYYLLKKQEIK